LTRSMKLSGRSWICLMSLRSRFGSWSFKDKLIKTSTYSSGQNSAWYAPGFSR
jgi:hypothetical protein